jgi:hypothetical protein
LYGLPVLSNTCEETMGKNALYQVLVYCGQVVTKKKERDNKYHSHKEWGPGTKKKCRRAIPVLAAAHHGVGRGEPVKAVI